MSTHKRTRSKRKLTRSERRLALENMRNPERPPATLWRRPEDRAWLEDLARVVGVPADIGEVRRGGRVVYVTLELPGGDGQTGIRVTRVDPTVFGGLDGEEK